MRLRLHTLRTYLDFEWGFTKNLPKDEPKPAPATHIATPMTAYEPQRVGFRWTGPNHGFVTGDMREGGPPGQDV